MQDPESSARAGLIRSIAIYAALLATDLLVVSYIARSSPHGFGYVTLSVVGVLGVLLAYQAVQHYRDLRAPLAESVGVVQRKWKRADLIIAWDSYYIIVDRMVFRVRPEDYVQVDEAMYVKVVHFPHTMNVVSVHPGG